jgi:hypothetical protein
LTPAGIHRVALVLTSQPWLQRIPMRPRFAGGPRHQPTSRTPVIVSAVQAIVADLYAAISIAAKSRAP